MPPLVGLKHSTEVIFRLTLLCLFLVLPFSLKVYTDSSRLAWWLCVFDALLCAFGMSWNFLEWTFSVSFSLVLF